MSEIRRYELVDTDGHEDGTEYDDYDTAVEVARRLGYAVQANVYEYSDHELVWTPDGEPSWPPART